MRRAQNEDAVLVMYEGALGMVADGMGGNNGGEIASQCAMTEIRQHMVMALAGMTSFGGTNPQASLDQYPLTGLKRAIMDAIAAANKRIFEMASANSYYAGMGTTLILSLCYQNCLFLFHVGDSRAYRLRQGQLTQLTRDHSVVQELVDLGVIKADQAQSTKGKNLITRAIGVHESVDVEAEEFALEAGDIILLCSDGLSDLISSDHIKNTIMRHESDSDLNAACDHLITEANHAGGRDNISVVLLKVKNSAVQ